MLLVLSVLDAFSELFEVLFFSSSFDCELVEFDVLFELAVLSLLLFVAFALLLELLVFASLLVFALLVVLFLLLDVCESLFVMYSLLAYPVLPLNFTLYQSPVSPTISTLSSLYATSITSDVVLAFL